jgi:hypothetical protein
VLSAENWYAALTSPPDTSAGLNFVEAPGADNATVNSSVTSSVIWSAQ